MRGAGAPRDKADAGTPGQLAMRFGHVGGGRFVPAGDHAHAVAMLVQAVEHGQIAFARHAEDGVGAIDRKRVGKQLPAGTRRTVGGHGGLRVFLMATQRRR
ncbi:hypothetical protein D3C72_1653300 [compost metagenome]